MVVIEKCCLDVLSSAVKSAVKTAYTCSGLEHGTSSVEDMVMCDGCESWFHW